MSNRRNLQRFNVARHVHAAGPRPVLEALLAVEQGKPLDAVLEDFGQAVPARVYHEVGADDFPVDSFQLITGGRNDFRPKD